MKVYKIIKQGVTCVGWLSSGELNHEYLSNEFEPSRPASQYYSCHSDLIVRCGKHPFGCVITMHRLRRGTTSTQQPKHQPFRHGAPMQTSPTAKNWTEDLYQLPGQIGPKKVQRLQILEIYRAARPNHSSILICSLVAQGLPVRCVHHLGWMPRKSFLLTISLIAGSMQRLHAAFGTLGATETSLSQMNGESCCQMSSEFGSSTLE